MTFPPLHKGFIAAPLFLSYFLGGGKTSFSMLVLLVFVGCFVMKDIWSSQTIHVPPLAIGVSGLFFILCISSIINQPPLDSFLLSCVRLIIYFLTAWMVFNSINGQKSEMLKASIIVVALAEALFVYAAKWNGQETQNAGFLKNSLHAGLLFPLALAAVLSFIAEESHNFKWKLFFYLAAVALMGGILLIRSRAGLLLAIGLIFYFLNRKLKIASVLSGILILVMFLLYKEKIFFYLEIDSENLRSTLSRGGIWLSAAKSIVEKPFLGWGLGNFEEAFYQHQQPSREFFRFGKSTIFAHNGFLQIAAEAGLPAALSLWGGLVVLVWKGREFLLREKFYASVLIIFFLTSLINYTLFLPLNGLIFVCAVSVLARNSNLKYAVLSISHSLVLKLAVSAVFFLGIGVMGCRALSIYFQNQGNLMDAARIYPPQSDVWYEMALENIKKSEAPFSYLDQAIRWNSKNAFYWQRKAVSLIAFAPHESAEIEQSFTRAQQLAPQHAPFYIQEAFFWLTKKNFVRSKDLFLKASSLEPVAPLPHYGLGLIYRATGDLAAAQVEFSIALIKKKKQVEMENDQVYAGPYAAMFQSEYAKFLFNVTEEQVNHQLKL